MQYNAWRLVNTSLEAAWLASAACHQYATWFPDTLSSKAVADPRWTALLASVAASVVRVGVARGEAAAGALEASLPWPLPP